MAEETRPGSPEPERSGRAPVPADADQVLATLRFANAAHDIPRARDAVADAVGDLLDRERIEDLRLLTSELVSNCFRHGRGPVLISVTCDPDFIVVTVSDSGEGDVRVRELDDRPGGYGLRLVEALSERWEQVENDRGTTVRFWIRP